MTDEGLRALERRFRETGEVADEARWLARRVSDGLLARADLEGAAWLGHEAAAVAAGIEPVRSIRDRTAAFEELLAIGPGETDASARRHERGERDERGARQLWLAKVAEELGERDRARLEAAPCISGRAVDLLVAETSFAREEALDATPGRAFPGFDVQRMQLGPPGAITREWSEETRAERFAEAVGHVRGERFDHLGSLDWERDDDEPAVLMPFDGNPGYVVPFGWALERLERLFPIEPLTPIVLQRLDGRAGISVSESRETRSQVDEETGEELSGPSVTITTATWSESHA